MFHPAIPSFKVPMGGTAVLSPCGLYRYALTRRWGMGSRGLFVTGLNPSTADAEIPDPTVRKITGFAKLWGFDWFALGNLCALRATFPKDLHASIKLMGLDHAVGPDNNEHLIRMMRACERILLAWGVHGERSALQERVRDVVEHVMHEMEAQADSRGAAGGVGAVVEVGHIGINKGGSPQHPLMVGYAQPFVPMSVRELDRWAA